MCAVWRGPAWRLASPASGRHQRTGDMVGDGVDPAVAEAYHWRVDYARVGTVDPDAAITYALGKQVAAHVSICLLRP